MTLACVLISFGSAGRGGAETAVWNIIATQPMAGRTQATKLRVIGEFFALWRKARNKFMGFGLSVAGEIGNSTLQRCSSERGLRRERLD